VSLYPLIGISMGDPAGIGPEIIVKALAEGKVYDYCRPLVLGDPHGMDSALSRISRSAELHLISTPSDAAGRPGQIDLLPLSDLKSGVSPGNPTLEGGAAMVSYIVKAVEMAQRGQIEAMVTCPINKALMHQAGYHFEGHTQLIANLTGTRDYVMMLAGERLRVALVTIHCSLKEVPLALSKEKIYRTICITAEAMRRDFGFETPSLAVAALNPHAGEEGLFGREEAVMIEPAVKQARDRGYDVVGPFPADTLFHKAASGRFQAVVAMYHDQGLIPLKLLHFSDAVNVTLGLPIIRTSVDHGTAYDIAGKDTADASSLKAAIQMAARMVKNRKAAASLNSLDHEGGKRFLP
jgi:4-hydroxythreonine-4-phosphate dehydrogenase